MVVDGRDREAFRRVRALGGSAISVPLRPGPAAADYLREAREDHGLAVLGVIDRDSFGSRLDWRASADADLDWITTLVERGSLDALAIGREPDDGMRRGGSDDPLVLPRGGVGSWVLPLRELAELIALVRDRMRDVPGPIPLVLGGLCSWRPELLDRLDLSLLDGILIHPYGAGADPEAAIGEYLDALAAVLEARGLTGRVRLGVGELGRSDQEDGRGLIADWFGQVLTALDRRGDVDCCFVCCDSDRTLDGYGQFDVRDRAKPAVSSIFAVGQRLPDEVPLFRLPPEEPEDAPEEPEGEPEEPGWEDQYFTPEQVAAALGEVDHGPPEPRVLAGLVRSLWPAFGPYLAEYGAPEDPAPRIALLAAVYVGTGGRFAPTVEGGSYTRAEHRYGSVLGNRYHGDGYRYRARGLVRIRGRAAYEHYQQALGLPLLEEPDLALEPAVAAGITATLFAERGLFEAALRGDWLTIWRAVDPGLNGYDPFLSAVQALFASLDERAEAAPSLRGPLALGAALARTGDPYVPGGAGPGGFDGPGLVQWAYEYSGSDPLPASPDALFALTDPVGASRLQPGDLVFYEYGDPVGGGARFDHVALAVDDGLVLDARVGAGVGYRAHVRGAIRRYRRMRGGAGADEGQGEEGEVAWQEERAELLRRLDVLAGRLGPIRQRLDGRVEIPDQPAEKESKARWVEWGRIVHRWRTRDDEDVARHLTALEVFERDLRDLIGRPKAAEGGTNDGEGE